MLGKELLLTGSIDALRSIDVILGRRCAYGSIFERNTQEALRVSLQAVEPFTTHAIGNYRVTAYPANHGSEKGCLLYAIEQGEQAIFYGTDTSILSEKVWEHIRSAGTRFDLVVLDHTYGLGFEASPPDHLASVDVIAYVNRLRRSGLLKDNAKAYATHISHEGNLEHDELDGYAEAHGYRIAFDGLALSFAD